MRYQFGDWQVDTSSNELRRALDDNASEARYVETLSKKGYRTIAKVAPVDETDIAAASKAGTTHPAAYNAFLRGKAIQSVVQFPADLERCTQSGGGGIDQKAGMG